MCYLLLTLTLEIDVGRIANKEVSQNGFFNNCIFFKWKSWQFLILNNITSIWKKKSKDFFFSLSFSFGFHTFERKCTVHREAFTHTHTHTKMALLSATPFCHFAYSFFSFVLKYIFSIFDRFYKPLNTNFLHSWCRYVFVLTYLHCELWSLFWKWCQFEACNTSWFWPL